MPASSVLGYVEKFQTLLVGAIGFMGVIATLLTNAYLARRQHERYVAHESTVLRVAILAELMMIRDAYCTRIETIDNAAAGQGILFPTDTMTEVYTRLLDRIGLLTGKQIEPVLHAYALAHQLPSRVMLLATDRNPSPERGAMIFIPNERIQALRALHANYLQGVESAISALSS